MNLTINGVLTPIADDDPNRMLLWVLRDELELTGTKYGCGAGLCGACTVIVDGVATRACITPVSLVADRSITTIEGLASPDGLHPVQQAFIDHQVPQCGWCMSGQIMTAAALLAATPAPNADDIDSALGGNLCRCGCYVRIRRAVAAAAQTAAAKTSVTQTHGVSA